MDTWDLYFASLAGWMLHPGYNRSGTIELTLIDIAEMADKMMEIRDGRRMGSSSDSSS